MSLTAEHILQSFDRLPEAEKKEVASEIIRRSVHFDLPSLSDEELVSIAEELFLELDSQETRNG